ncbi:MAG: methyl-accepting chemotaxis protein [Pontiellaceae bacterium]|nr:methyl-accepting chemotaxis protein [Pontiellaceae bacterium]
MNIRLSLKTKMTGTFAVLVIFSCLILTVLSYANSKKMSKELTHHTLTMKMKGDISAAKQYVEKYLGSINPSENGLVDENGNLIEGNFEMVDTIQKDLGVVATIFAKEKNDFRRITTNIMKPDGTRAVGTFLGESSAAYNPVMNKELFVGEAVILEKSYLTAYDPILDKNGALIGILFVGIPRDIVNAIANGHVSSMLTQSIIAFLIVLAISITAALWFSVSLSRKVTQCGQDLQNEAQQVNGAASQLSNSSNSLAEGSTEQAASLEETSSSLEEMATMTKNSAQNALEANTLAEKARDAAVTGTESMQTMVAAIHEIQSSANETAKIVKVIDEIAFQTNLLALNAAVEAARAGEAGKGFAVVAEEVRNLAKRSAEAAKNTTELINTSVANASNGVKLSEGVNSIFSDIVEAISKTSQIMSHIAEANEEQAEGIEQVNVAVSQIDIVTQRNAAGAEESASAAAELTAYADSMLKSVAQLQAIITGGNKA